MDSKRFDYLTRRVGKQTDRRSMFKAAAGVGLALLGTSVLRRDAAAQGYDGDPCMTNADCREGLTCNGGSTGILGGALAGAPYGPPGVTLPILSGREGRCRYRNSCGRDGDGCRRSSDCCDGFACHNNRCRSK